jgi:SAM-dependent methyltransferase
MSKTQEIEWFERWFNSPYYHMLYGNRDHKEAADFINRLIDFLQVEKGANVLDLACGKGRHSLQLNSKGFDVIGIDLSEKSIESALEHSNESLNFFVHDMRQLFWLEHFDLVANLFTSFGYFHNKEDDQQMMNGVFESLKPGGRFVIDFMNAKKVVANLVNYEEKQVDDVKFVINRKVEDAVIVKSIDVIDGLDKTSFVEEVDELYLADFIAYLNNAGFSIKSTYGNYQLEQFDEVNSDRLIIVAEKPAG